MRKTGYVVAFFVGTVIVAACGKSSAPPASWEPDRSCTAHDDCRPVEGCCPAPCSNDVINVRDLAKMRARVEEQCKTQRKEECPQAGACAPHQYLCVRGRCALVLEGSPDWPPP